jgi:hypothetical protein
VIDWDALVAPDNGDSEIIAYHLQWLYDGTWRDLYGSNPGETLTTFTVTTNIQKGTTYEFRLRAENIFGVGELSEVTEIKAAGIPYKIMSPATISIDTDGTVKI